MQCIRINQIKLPIEHGDHELEDKILTLLKINREQLTGFEIVKKSVDARKKGNILYIYSVNVFIDNYKKVMKKIKNPNVALVDVESYQFPKCGATPMNSRPVIVGLGPAGLFCGYYLAKNGYRPLIIERGEDVDKRQETVDYFWETGQLNTESNVQFGEGGAGTFSDGKLNTLVKDKTGRNHEVLDTLVRFGAKPEITYVNKPHIGTDVLKDIVKAMRQEICSLGGEVRFNCKMTDLVFREDDTGKKCISEIVVNDSERIKSDHVVLALGHSARDTFEMLYQRQVPMSAKAFAVGVRVEHPQEMINRIMYGVSQHELLEAADYKVTYNTDTHGIYSFCMCPGGYVVNASSEEGRLAVNGMSYSDRGGTNSNSAIVVTVSPEDYGKEHVLKGMEFQRRLEENAYREGNGKIPVQCFGDFCEHRKTTSFGEVQPAMKGAYEMADLRNVLPDFLSELIMEGMHGFTRQMPSFDRSDALLSAVESRTSSPIRMERDGTCNSIGVTGLYPCGEGAGYAGGITSAAMDGLRVAEAIVANYAPPEME